MAPLRFRHHPITVLESSRNSPAPENPISETGSLVTLPSSRESVSLRISPSFLGKARIFRQYGHAARPYGRQRRASSTNIALRNGSVSVGRYSSTALSPMRVAAVRATPSAIGPLGIQQYR